MKLIKRSADSDIVLRSDDMIYRRSSQGRWDVREDDTYAPVGGKYADNLEQEYQAESARFDEVHKRFVERTRR